VDAVPAALVLAQAANESGWGTSRFAQEANNLFGMWTWDKDAGLLPERRAANARHFVRVFNNLRGAVDNYLHTINTGPAYRELRMLREQQRLRGEPLSAWKLAAGLSRYSERGEEYVAEIRSIIRFNRRANPTPSRTTHNTMLEVAWTVLPVIILVIIAIPSFRLLYDQLEIPEPELTIKTTGHQWYWSYEYPDHGIEFDAFMLREDELEPGQPRLLATDTEVVVPVDTTIKVLVTASDVIHAWKIPALGSMVDAVPGRINETWFRATREGVFYGQCSELCGRDHAFMPITVRVVSQDEFDEWIEQVIAATREGNETDARLVQASNDDVGAIAER
jgi:cytochrome c oxidase subunit 2